MFFCPKCNNIYTIMKDYVEEENDYSVSSDASPKKEKKQDSLAKIVFKCINCGFKESIAPKTLIINKTIDKSNVSIDDSKYEEMIYDKTLPRTRNYICINKSCESHKNPDKREAVWFKYNSYNYGIKYACCTCKSVW